MSPPSPLVLCVLFLVFLPQAVLLSRIDGLEHRLPNRQVGLLTASVLGALVAASLLDAATRSLLTSSLVLALITTAAGIGLALLAPGVIGMGDAKTAPVVILLAAMLGPSVLIASLLSVVIVGGLAGSLAWALTRRGDSRFAFGPVLLSAPLLGVLGAPAIAAVLGGSW